MTSPLLYSLTHADIFALSFFILVWMIYALVIDMRLTNKRGLSQTMAKYRQRWMIQMATRDVRMIDAQTNFALQGGTSFFASTSLFAIGGALTLLGATDKVVDILGELPMQLRPTRLQWEVKVFCLVLIFTYAFFKFAWAYRLFNYCSILIGATPHNTENTPPTQEMLRMAEKAALMNSLAGIHFSRGQRAFFFALGFLGWFIHAYVLFFSTIAVVLVLWQRQFHSRALEIVQED